MDNNKKQIKSLNRLAIIQELIEKTKNCSLFWVETSLGQFRTQFTNYDFYLTKTSTNTYNLDIIKNKDLYMTYNSLLQSNVKDLYDTVGILSSDSALNKSRRINEFIGRKGSCRQGEIGSSNKFYPISVQGFGLLATGAVTPQIFRRKFVYLNPTSIEFDTAYPWSGSHLDIDESDIFNQADGDSTFIRQQVAGLSPTVWGYCDVNFNLSTLPSKPPFVIQSRVVARRESEPGMNLTIQVILNDSSIYQQTIFLNESYSYWSSGDLYLGDYFSSIKDLKIRLSTFTNVGNLLPRAVRVTGVDLGVTGYDLI